MVTLTSCLSTYKIPEEYVPDEDLVYLKQRLELNPIKYDPVMTSPYEWNVDIEVNKESPDFLKERSFTNQLKPNFYNDAKLFLEVKEHLLHIKEEKIFVQLKSLTDAFKLTPPEPRKISKGKKYKTLQTVLSTYTLNQLVLK